MKEIWKKRLSIVTPIPTNKDFLRMQPEGFHKKAKTVGELRDKMLYKYNVKLLKKLGFRRKSEMFK